ncbi:hypothetical protein, partial [Leifsonia aquatica]|uniref:hypothetical protein n=1 Tax=Leifsonia aquatica TaxID=144185 RepID=UPI0013B4615B
MTVDPKDAALHDMDVPNLTWYHTATQPNWPTPSFDPGALLTPETRLRMGGDGHVQGWVERQRSQALHVGTYEAAVHNMFRRIEDQADHGNQFYLYRVHLHPTVTVREGWLIDPSNFAGDVVLNEVCPPGVDVTRYLNYHEDPGSVSLALGRQAISRTQQIAIPHDDATAAEWVTQAVKELEQATSSPLPPDRPWRSTRITPQSARSRKAQEIVEPLTATLPANLRSGFIAAVRFHNTMEPSTWANYVAGLLSVIQTPHRITALLD